MKKYLSFSLALLVSAGSFAPSFADPQVYAQDKLANAQAQLDKLVSQREALNKLIKAVRKDLRAAKIRSKAENIQVQADTDRQDAAVLVEQAGVAVELPNLMATKSVQSTMTSSKDDIDLMFRDQKQPKAVFFPGGDAGKTLRSQGLNNDADYK